MIKKLEIKNFKGIGDPGVEVEFKPITLLFGPNSAGKSTIIQALHYAREIFLRKNFNPTSVLSGGSILNLGGFRNIVHNHNIENTITLKFDFDLDSLSSGLQSYSIDEKQENDFIEEKNTFESLCYGLWYASVTIDIQLNKDTDIVRATKYKLDINNKPFAEIKLDDKNPRDIHSYFSYLNIKHSIIPEEVTDDPPGSIFYAFTNTDPDNFKLRLIKPQSVFTLENESLEVDPQHFRRDSLTFNSDEFFNYYLILLRSICRLISEITNLLRDDLDMFRYIGPIREIPSRNFIAESYDDINRWANGLFAWDYLYNNKINIDKVNEWLKRLKIEYQIVRRKQFEVDDDKKNIEMEDELSLKLERLYDIIDAEPRKEKLFRELKDLLVEILLEKRKTDNYSIKYYLKNQNNTKVLPSDLGIGISQVIPIVIGVLFPKNFGSILSIEQPELHIHPAIQVELADLFIEAINPPKEAKFSSAFYNICYLVETHSEHLMLRFLRRIEETTKNKLDKTLRLKPDSINVYWCESTQEGLKVELLPIDESGEFTRKWPKGFFEERAEELFPE